MTRQQRGSYSECVRALQTLDCVPSTRREYESRRRELTATGVRHTLPARPDSVFAKRGWCCWHNYLRPNRGHTTACPQYGARTAHDRLKKRVQAAGVASVKQYKKLRQTPQFADVPRKPHAKYKGKGWCCHSHFFGTIAADEPCVKRIARVTYTAAQLLIATKELTTQEAYRTWHRASRPSGVPSDPSSVYAAEWCCWKCFLPDAPSCSEREIASAK